MAGNDDQPSHAWDLLHKFQCGRCGFRVQAPEGLIQQQDIRTGHEGSCQLGFLDHTARIRPDQVVTSLVEKDLVKQALYPTRGLVAPFLSFPQDPLEEFNGSQMFGQFRVGVNLSNASEIGMGLGVDIHIAIVYVAAGWIGHGGQ